MQLTTMRRVTVLCLLSLSLFLVLVSAAAASPISAKKARLKAVEAQLNKVHVQSDVAVERYDRATSQLHGVQAKVEQNQHLLKLAVYKLGVANEQLQTRARQIYMARDVDIIDVLLSSRSFDELITQIDMMKRLGDSDAAAAAAATAYQQEINDRRLALESDKKAAATLVAQRQVSKDQVLALQSQLQSTAGGLQSQIAELEKAQAAAAAKAAAQAATQAAAAQAAAAKASSASTSASSSSSSSSGGSSSGGGGPGYASVVAIAQRYLGVPYVWGGASPSGFDCSGLAMYCYAQVGVSLSHGATDQQHASTPVSLSNLRPGDLVFFGSPSFSHHVGIYVSGGQMIDAPYTGAVVRYDSI
ncbi:MAG TPA: NlpC/P60 family protein, partial [Candidatus Limnocylindrales bacterium]